jgi:hypothetical protein
MEDRYVLSTLTVINNHDSGPGSLRAEIAAAKSKDTIVFAPSLNGQTITLTSAELIIATNLTIQGPGAGQLTINGNRQFNGFAGSYYGFRVFEVDHATVTIAGLTITNGYAGVYVSPTSAGGGGVLNWGGNLTLNNCTISNNYAAYGGGIDNENGATLTVNNCMVTGNHFTATANQIGGGGIFNAYLARATINDSTISNNSGPPFPSTTGFTPTYGDGGGIYNGGSMTLSATTVTGNSPYEWGGGIYEDTYASLSILHDSNVSGNSPGGDLFLAYGAGPVTIKASHVGVVI